jgi:hypothetical protein
MSREGYKTSTIKAAVKTLKAVANRCNITNPTELKTYLATAHYSENRRHKIISDVDRLYRQLGIRWERPLSGPVETPTFLPTEEEINQLIGGLGPILSIFDITLRTIGIESEGYQKPNKAQTANTKNIPARENRVYFNSFAKGDNVSSENAEIEYHWRRRSAYKGAY